MIRDNFFIELSQALIYVRILSFQVLEKLWDVVTKRGHSNNYFEQNDIPGSRTKVQVVPSTTEEKLICGSLNFSRTKVGIDSGLGVEQNSAAKLKITGSATTNPCDKMTKIKQKELLLGIEENKAEPDENLRDMANIKRRATQSIDSLASTNVSLMGCAVSTATPNNVTKSLLSPTTSLSSFNKRAKESAHASDLHSETPKACVSGLLMKRGLVKQTLRYNQDTPSSSRNCQMSIRIGERENLATYQPCKSSNIEPQTITTPLFRLPVNQNSLTSRKQQEQGLNMNANLATCDSLSRGNLTQTASKNTTTDSVAGRNCPMRLITPCTTPKGKGNLLTPPLGGKMKLTPQVTGPVACFNGGSVTPPLCHCGRRTRRRSMINPGPNQGRAFFTCFLNHGRSSLNLSAEIKKPKSGCNFFRWEIHL